MASAGSNMHQNQGGQQQGNSSGRTFQHSDYASRIPREDGSTSNISILNGSNSTTATRKISSSSLSQAGFYSSNLSTSPNQSGPPLSSPSLPTLPSNSSLDPPVETINQFQNSLESHEISERDQQRDREERDRVGLGLGSIAESSSLGSLVNVGLGVESSTNGGAASSTTTTTYKEDDLIPVGFDEGILKALCDSDCGMPLLFDRMKQGMASCREASVFLKKRALIEEEYARSLIKLSRTSLEGYSLSEGKPGTFAQSWQSLVRSHELLGDNRLKFATQLSDMSDDLVLLGKEVDKTRKSNKDLGTRLERGLADQENLVDKARSRFESSAEELERILVLKQGESLRDPANIPHAYSQTSSLNSSSTINSAGVNIAKDNSKRTFGKAISKLKGPKTLAQVVKQEDESRTRMGQSSDAYRSQVIGAQAVRQEYFNLQLPRILRSLKESVDECDLGTQYHLSRYAYLFESTLVSDGLTISPLGPDQAPGLKTLVENIDNREDFKSYMTQYTLSWNMSGQRGPRREGLSEDVFIPATSAARPLVSPHESTLTINQPPPIRPTFGIDLGEQMLRDAVEVPRILEKCCEAIELHGLDSMGIYRLSGTTSRVQRLKSKLDYDIEAVDLLSEENLLDINDISAVLKLWFREMPEPLLTWELYHGFIEAAKIENDRLRHIRLHERVNDLPDPNYATLKFLMAHLDLIQQNEPLNQMSCSNLAIVFGPNLLGAPPPNYPIPTSNNNSMNGNSSALADMSWQCKCIETILLHYSEIFVDVA